MPIRAMRARSFSSRSSGEIVGKPKRGVTRELISVAPRLLVRKTMVAEKSTLRMSPKCQNALVQYSQKQIPERVRHFSISSKSTKLS